MQTNPTKQISVQGDGKTSALDLLQEASRLGKQNLKRYASFGAIWLTSNPKGKPQRLRRLKRILGSDQTLDLYYNPELLNQDVSPPNLIDDQHNYSVWLKPRGMLSQGSKWADHSALYRWVEMNYQPEGTPPRQCWIVHRLDRATCGLMLLAHTKTLASQLTQMFEHKKVQKTYLAVIWGAFPTTTQTIDSDIDGKKAISHVSLVRQVDAELIKEKMSLVEVKIETGRKHQIRKHLAEIGFPIVGDRLHGNSQRNNLLNPQPDLQLTAYKLEFECPVENRHHSYTLTESQLDLILKKDHA